MDHKHMESEETSNDTTMISELLKSAEVTQQSHQLETEDKQEQMQQSQTMNKHHLEIPPLTAIGTHSTSTAANIIMLNQGFPSTDDSNKLHHQMRHVHIPYILNGELYQIQTQDGENVTVKCCHCPPDRVYRGSVRSTGNFHMHIKRRHPDLLEKLHDMKVNALLERRDRLMRNRKISSRSSRPRPTHTVASTTSAVNTLGGAYKEESQLYLGAPVEPSLTSATSQPELSLLHTHKLKIKTVFQRHQMQQREAAEMRNWNNGDYVVVPIAKLTSNEETDDDGGPINYCLKSPEDIETHPQIQPQQLQSHLIQQQNNTQIGATSSNDCTNFSLVQQQLPMTIGNNNEYIYDNQQRDFSAASSQSISPMSNFSSENNNNNSQYTNNMGMTTYHNTQQHNNPLTHPIHQRTTLSIVKPEDLLIPTAMEQQAIDLTLHNDSGIFSDSNESRNNILQNTKPDKRAGSQQTIAPAATHQQTDTCGGAADNSSSKKWQDLLMQVETSLRDIQHEMNIRNQIESNRMFLDIAKFKFLHPAFQFNW